MQVTPESKSVLDRLLTGETMTAGKISVGPFDETTRRLLKVIIDNYDVLRGTPGAPQVVALLEVYGRCIKAETQETQTDSELSQAGTEHGAESVEDAHEGETSSEQGTIPGFETPPQWGLHELKCRSIMGIAPRGEEFTFSFEGKSNLLYGPNGSGKSSLLGAVVWGLTGITLTDAFEPKEIASIHEHSEGHKLGRKIRDWPTISTLPDSKNPLSVSPDSMAMIQLVSCDGRKMWLRRTIGEDLEVQFENQDWMPCHDLSQYGIGSLDLQLSIIAPTVFGRKAIENAEDSRKILSLMLGYDPLEDIGDLVGKLARNRTVLFKGLDASARSEREKLSTKVGSLGALLPDGSPLKDEVKTLQSVSKLSAEKIKEMTKKVSDQIEHSNASLGKILGIRESDGDASVSTGLDENLIKAIGHVEKGFAETWPSLSAIELDAVLPGKDGLASEQQLAKLEEELEAFTRRSQGKIEKRLKWWRKETAPHSRAKLLLMAAQSYDPVKMECPVCDQSVKNRSVKNELESLKKLDRKLLEEVKLFFGNLGEDLDNTVPGRLRDLSKHLPNDRLAGDWEALKRREELAELSSIIQGFETPLTKLVREIETLVPRLPQLLPPDAEPAFLQAGSPLICKVNCAYRALTILRWASTKLGSVREKLGQLITAPEEENGASLLALLSKGKSAALEIKPLRMLQAQLCEVETDNNIMLERQKKLDTLDGLRDPLDELKKLAKYAIEETTSVFDEIKDKAIDNWKLLYPEACAGLYPSRLAMTGRGGKSIESLLSQGEYEVPGAHFANAGLQRAIALSFLCALFDKHPKGLGFVVFDDPILSLDEDHRERWSGRILAPRMKDMQVIVATHQRQFVTNCKHDFASGKVVELNPRDGKGRISWMPGDILDQAEDLLRANWKFVPNVLRQYCEEILITLQAYSQDDFFSPHNLPKSLERYERLAEANPLVGARQKQIVAELRKPEIDRVLNPGSHALTNKDLTESMVETCLAKLRESVNRPFLREIEHLLDLRTRSLRGSVIPISIVSFSDDSEAAVFDRPFLLPVVGRAAARAEGWVRDWPEEVSSTTFAPQTAVFACVDTLNPVIRKGECVLLAGEDVQPEDDDIVAIVTSNGDRYLRKLWSEGGGNILQAIHPTRAVPAIRSLEGETAMRKVVGVLYEPALRPNIQASSQTLEWYPYSRFPSKIIGDLKVLTVEGDSLDPIARKGQKVLVGERESAKDTTVEDGGLAALEVDDEAIGNVIKQVYRKSDVWILVSPNPVIPYTPDLVPMDKIVGVWPLRGVLFDTVDE